MKEKLERNKKIIQHREQGYSLRAIAKIFKISAPRVLAILNFKKNEPKKVSKM